MSLVNKLWIVVFLLLTVGCARTPQVITEIEYVQVNIPVRYKLDRPSRPKFRKNDTVPTYLARLIEYTSKLEVIIDENNSKD